MEYLLELSPLQIRLNLEMYCFLDQFINIRIDDEEIQKIKNGVQIMSVDKKNYLIKIHISYVSQMIHSSLINKINFFFSKNNLEQHLHEVYNFIVEKSQNISNFPNLYKNIHYYLKQVSNTLMIDIFSEHFAELIRYIIKMALRKQYNQEKLNILSNNLANDLLLTELDFTLLNKYLKGQYWNSSRHLELVSNKWEPLENQIKNFKIPDERLKTWIIKNISPEIKEDFLLYLDYSKLLSNLKLIDAQIQVRAAYLLKNTINTYIHKNNKKIDDYIWDIESIDYFIQKIMKSYRLSNSRG